MTDTDAEHITGMLQHADSPVLLDFWAPWCAPCLALEPWLEQLAQRYTGRLTIARCDVQQHESVINTFALRGVPTLIGFINGQEVARCTGGNVAQLHAMINRLFQQPAAIDTPPAFNGDNVTCQNLYQQVVRLPETELAGQVAEWIRHPETAPGIPALVWQLMLFLTQQYPVGDGKPAFLSLLGAISCGSMLSTAGQRFACQLLDNRTTSLGPLFSTSPALSKCWQTLQQRQLSWLHGENSPESEWQAATEQQQQLCLSTDAGEAAMAENLALLTGPLDAGDLSVFLELYRLASDEQADLLYLAYQDKAPSEGQQAIEQHLHQVLVHHTALLRQVLAASARPGG